MDLTPTVLDIDNLQMYGMDVRNSIGISSSIFLAGFVANQILP